MPGRNEDLGAAAVPVWNVETLRAHVIALLAAFDVRMTERHEAAMRAIDVAFQAQKEAIATAFLSQKEAVTAALAAADRAVLKAELASEKRFEAVNEFRATLADQQRTLMPRAESDALRNAVEAKLDVSVAALNEKIQTIQQAQIASGSLRVGASVGWQYAVAVIGLLTMVIGIAAYFRSR